METIFIEKKISVCVCVCNSTTVLCVIVHTCKYVPVVKHPQKDPAYTDTTQGHNAELDTRSQGQSQEYDKTTVHSVHILPTLTEDLTW